MFDTQRIKEQRLEWKKGIKFVEYCKNADGKITF